MWKKEGLGEEPKAVREANEEYRMDMDSVGMFVTEKYIIPKLGKYNYEEDEEEEELDAIIMEEVDEFGNAVEEGNSSLDNFIEDDVEDGFED